MNPRAFDSEQRRKQILDHASRMFAQHGISCTSMRALAEACNCNEALLYRHFPNKQALFKEVIESVQNRVTDHWLELSRTAPSGMDALRSIVSSIHNGATEDLRMYANLVHCIVALMRNPEMEPLLASGLIQQVQIFTDVVSRGIEDGSISRKRDAASCAWCILVRSFASSVIDSLLPKESNPIPRHGDSPESVLSCLAEAAEPARDESGVQPHL